MRNTLNDLNNYLFAQIERLDDDELSEEGLDREIKRSKALRDISESIIENARLQLDAAELAAEYTERVGSKRAGAIALGLLGGPDE